MNLFKPLLLYFCVAFLDFTVLFTMKSETESIVKRLKSAHMCTYRVCIYNYFNPYNWIYYRVLKKIIQFQRLEKGWKNNSNWNKRTELSCVAFSLWPWPLNHYLDTGREGDGIDKEVHKPFIFHSVFALLLFSPSFLLGIKDYELNEGDFPEFVQRKYARHSLVVMTLVSHFIFL